VQSVPSSSFLPFSSVLIQCFLWMSVDIILHATRMSTRRIHAVISDVTISNTLWFQLSWPCTFAWRICSFCHVNSSYHTYQYFFVASKIKYILCWKVTSHSSRLLASSNNSFRRPQQALPYTLMFFIQLDFCTFHTVGVTVQPNMESKFNRLPQFISTSVEIRLLIPLVWE
jgi:hypothetical protein